MKRSSRLKTKYGKLTPLTDGYLANDSRQYVDVRCDCGKEKTVLLQSLQRGATRSCGAGPCRGTRSKVERDPNYVPRSPRALTVKGVKRVWDAYHAEGNRTSLAVIARRNKVKLQTLQSMFHAVRKCGGIQRYVALLTPQEK